MEMVADDASSRRREGAVGGEEERRREASGAVHGGEWGGLLQCLTCGTHYKGKHKNKH